MQVKRIDLFDYQITLTEEEFNIIKLRADSSVVTIEVTLAILFESAVEVVSDSQTRKET